MDFDGLMGCEKLEKNFDGSQIPFHGSLAKYLQLLWWCSFADQSCLKIFKMQKSAFSTFLFLNRFQLWSQILGGCHWGNLCDVVLVDIWYFFSSYLCYLGHLFLPISMLLCKWGCSRIVWITGDAILAYFFQRLRSVVGILRNHSWEKMYFQETEHVF